jgi:hypothetical protein
VSTSAITAGIKIDPEFRDLIPALDPQELDQLHKSLSASGCYTPLIVWKGEGILVDGHNRLEYCQQRGIQFQTVEMRFSSREVVKNWIILNQLGRRNVTPETASALRGILYNGRKKTKAEAGAIGGQANAEVALAPQDTAKEVAKETGVSARTIKNDAKLVDALNKLSIPVADWMAGKVKKTRKEIIAEAFPPKPKKEKPHTTWVASAPTEEAKPEKRLEILENKIEDGLSKLEADGMIFATIVAMLPRLTKDEIKELLYILNTRWNP